MRGRGLVARYGEPWQVTQGRPGYPRPAVEGLDPDLGRELVATWEEHAAQQPRLIWASRMVDPTLATSFQTGAPVAMDDRRVLLQVTPLRGVPEDFPSSAEVAERIVHVVNACFGIPDVEHFVQRARELMVAAVPGRASAW